MQFLESKAAGEDGRPTSNKKSPKANSAKKQTAQPHQRQRSSPPATTHAPLAAPIALHPNPPYTPPMNPEDAPFFPSPSPPASSPPPFSAYQTSYSPPSDNGFYTGHPVTTWMGTAAITATAAPTLPPMTHFSEAYSTTGSKGNESMSFGSYDYSLGVPTTASPYDSNPHVSTHHQSQQHQHQASRSSALLPRVSTFPFYGGSKVLPAATTSSSSSSTTATAAAGHLAAPDLYRSRYPPPPPARV